MSLDTERFRFTGAQVHLIRPGLADLFAEYNYVACTGSLREPVVDKNGHPIPAQVPAVPQWAVIASALDKLYSLNARAVTMSVTSLELLAFILGVRLTERLLRLGRLQGWTRNHHQRARRLIRRLENDRRRALARYLEVHGPEGMPECTWSGRRQCEHFGAISSLRMPLCNVWAF
ncbi:MAG TPA: hypothetical protein VEB03_00740 [Candidatus Nanoarchaeia archaeon]|nr:hypothetical protein [Candidatus Nanoarchaeia archaeon]